MLKPIMNVKAARLMELDNTLLFEVDRRDSKKEIKKEVEEYFKVKVYSVNTLIRLNKKFAYVKLDMKNPAIDVATKLGMI